MDGNTGYFFQKQFLGMLVLMNKNATGIGFVLVIFLVATAAVPGVVSGANVSSKETPFPVTTFSPVIFFEGLSAPVNGSYTASELEIHSSIKKYDLLTFDIPLVREKLAKNETVVVRIDGVPYEMVSKKSITDTYGIECDATGCSGTLNNQNTSEIRFVLGGPLILGRIKVNGTNYIFDSTPKTEDAKVIQYVYSYKNVVSEGPSIPIDDVDVTRRPPTTRKIIEETTEETAGAQIPPATTRASSSNLIPLCALGLILLGSLIRR
jgi:hypothetical protein